MRRGARSPVRVPRPSACSRPRSPRSRSGSLAAPSTTSPSSPGRRRLPSRPASWPNAPTSGRRRPGGGARLRAARSLSTRRPQRAWEVARASGSIPLDRRVGMRLAATHAVESAAVAVDTAQRLGGGGAIYESSPARAASATSTPPRSTCSSARPPGSSPAARCSASSSTTHSCSRGRARRIPRRPRSRRRAGRADAELHPAEPTR